MKTVLFQDQERPAGPALDINSWSDAWLVAAIRNDPPDEAALEVLANRYLGKLSDRCRALVLNQQNANDLAQDTWCRVLRSRHLLKPEGNFPAYLTTIATNLWRDDCRWSKRAGSLAEHQLVSLDAEVQMEDGKAMSCGSMVPDTKLFRSNEQLPLRLDIEEAMSHLPPLLYEVLMARFEQGESCAEIGRRYRRSEQTVSGWVRKGLRQLKQHLKK